MAIEKRQGRLNVLNRAAARIGVAVSAKCRRTIGDSMRFGGKAARDRGSRTGHGIVGRVVAALGSTGSCTEVLFYVIKPYRLGRQMPRERILLLGAMGLLSWQPLCNEAVVFASPRPGLAFQSRVLDKIAGAQRPNEASGQRVCVGARKRFYVNDRRAFAHLPHITQRRCTSLTDSAATRLRAGPLQIKHLTRSLLIRHAQTSRDQKNMTMLVKTP